MACLLASDFLSPIFAARAGSDHAEHAILQLALQAPSVTLRHVIMVRCSNYSATNQLADQVRNKVIQSVNN